MQTGAMTELDHRTKETDLYADTMLKTLKEIQVEGGMTPGPRKKTAKYLSESPDVGSNPFARAIEVSNKKLVTIKRESNEHQYLRRDGP